MRSKRTSKPVADAARAEVEPWPGASRRSATWPVAAFFLKVAVIYGLLVTPLFRAHEAYGWTFRAGCNMFFRNMGDGGRVYFSKNPAENMDQDTLVSIKNVRKQGAPGGTFEINSYTFGYLATAFLVALVLATPVPWPRRLLALAVGLGLVSAFVTFRVYLQLVDGFSPPSPIAAYSFGPFWKKCIIVLIKVLSMSPVTMYIAPVFIWILVTFRREDVARFAGRFFVTR
jgi:hypothetical protein